MYHISNYTITLTTAPSISGGSTTAEIGGVAVYASENYRYELLKTSIATLELPETSVAGKLRNTTGRSPSGTETSFHATGAETVMRQEL